MRRRVALVAVMATLGMIGFAAPAADAASASSHSGTMTVNTLFTGVSPVVAATGVFDGCTTVTDLAGDAKFVPGTAIFSGVKLVDCPSGTLQLAYHATFDKKLPGAHGSWRVIGGTGSYAGRHGGGCLTGDDNACDPMGTDGCVLDFYTGVIT